MKIEDYAFLSDTQTAALVGRNGSVDWLCFPRFDSASCFAALIGEPKNGRWLIAPSDDSARVTRKYRGYTLILETTFETKDGAVGRFHAAARNESGHRSHSRGCGRKSGNANGTDHSLRLRRRGAVGAEMW